MQVIVLTQDHDTWEELETRYRHIGISTAQLYIDVSAVAVFGSLLDAAPEKILI